MTIVPLLSRCNILGVQVSAINMAMALQTIRGWIEGKTKHYICVTPAHSIMDAHNDPGFKEILNQSGLTTPDGMAVVWLLKFHGFDHVSRVYGPDLMLAVCQASVERGWSHYFYGGAPGVGDQLARVLESKFPGLQIKGIYSPPFTALTPEEDRLIIDQINQAGADIVWVGISSPKQEKWMADHRDQIDSPVLIGVGAAFDFLSGNKRQAPKWIQKSGFEWLFRFIQEPTRLWKRYIQYPKFIFLNIGQILGLVKFD